MKILFHCYEFLPEPGGVGSYIYQMACSLKLMGHGPVIVTSRSEGLPEEEDADCGIVYRVYDKSEIRTSRVRDKVLSLAKQHGVQLIEGADHHGEMAQIIKCHQRPPVVVKIHGSNPIRVLQESLILYPWQRILLRLAHMRNLGQTRAERFSIEHADMTMIPSAKMRDELIKEGFSLPVRNEVLPNPVVAFTGELSAESDTPKILMVGRIDIGKGIQYLPNIIRSVAKEMPDAMLELAGNDSYARGLGSMKQWLVRRLGDAAHHVRFLGCLDRSALDRAYGEAWVVIIPSRWDNFPNIMLESMVRSKPVVASPNGGMPEMLEGTLCSAADPGSPQFIQLLLELLKNPSARKQAGESLRQKANTEYAPEVVVRKYLSILESWGIS